MNFAYRLRGEVKRDVFSQQDLKLTKGLREVSELESRSSFLHA
jgi:hypothetical protein